MESFGALITQDQTRLAITAAVVAVFGLVCLWAMLRVRAPKPDKVEALPAAKSAGNGAPAPEAIGILVLCASQTGQAEAIARRTVAALTAGGHNVKAMSLRSVTAQILRQAPKLLIVASTAGEGDAPDEAVRFERTLMRERLDLSGHSYAVLALGARSHGHFCAFGHRLDEWFRGCGAKALHACIEVDDLNASALKAWEGFLGSLGAKPAVARAEIRAEAPPVRWLLKHRQVLNPDSSAQKLVLVDLAPAGDMPAWQAGDLIEIRTPGGHLRDYSIASLPHEGHIRLLVRQMPDGDGSKWLTESLQPGESLDLRLKTHTGFHAPPSYGPLLLIGAGSGLAGLRAHLLATQATGRPCWLIYGERNPVTDGVLCDELLAWQEEGKIKRLDLAFSAVADGSGRYVQDVMNANARAVNAWLWGEGAVLVCGGLEMGKAVEAALRAHLGDDWTDEALATGRYRRDLY